MARSVQQKAGVRPDQVVREQDVWVRRLFWAIGGVVVLILTALLYGAVAGVFFNQPPRTATEFALENSATTVKQKPSDGKAWASYILALYNSGQKSAANDALKRGRQAADKQSLVWVNNAEIQMLLEEGNSAQAVKVGEKYLGYALTQRQAVLIERAKKGIKIDPGNDSELNPQLVDCLILLGKAYGNTKKWDDAIKAFNTALDLEPFSSDMLSLRGYAFLNRNKKGDAQVAVNNFKLALKLTPDYSPAAEGLKKAEAAVKKAPAPSGTATATTTKKK